MLSIEKVTFLDSSAFSNFSFSYPEKSLVIFQQQGTEGTPILSFHLFGCSNRQPKKFASETRVLEILISDAKDYVKETHLFDSLIITKEVTQLANVLFTYYMQEKLLYSVDQLLLSLVNQIKQVNQEQGMRTQEFSRVIDFMKNQVSQKLTLDDFCQALHMSPASLNRLCRKHAKKSVMAQFRAIKCQKATELLRETSVSIQEISSKLGFKNSSHFAITFKKIYGISPLDWRKREGGNSW